MRITPAVLIVLSMFACNVPLSAVAIENSSASEPAGNWQVNSEESSVKFRATQNGGGFEGEFGRFTADIGLDPENLKDAFIRAEIDISSVDAGSQDRNGALPTREWFHVKNFPVATFESREIQATGEGAYIANGQLTIKGVVQDISLPFTLDIDGSEASALAELELIRTDYNLGPKEDWVGESVAIAITISATKMD